MDKLDREFPLIDEARKKRKKEIEEKKYYDQFKSIHNMYSNVKQVMKFYGYVSVVMSAGRLVRLLVW